MINCVSCGAFFQANYTTSICDTCESEIISKNKEKRKEILCEEILGYIKKEIKESGEVDMNSILKIFDKIEEEIQYQRK